MILKLIYTLFLGLLVALFVGLGIDAFYEGPKMPDYPSELRMAEITKAEKDCDCQEFNKLGSTQEKYDQEFKGYEERLKTYNRDVSIISLIFAILILIASLTLFSKIKMIADGVLLGGVFTTAYSIIRGLMSENSKFRFLIVAVGLIIALVLGYIKFIRPKEENSEEPKV
jgi:hypothetical protein